MPKVRKSPSAQREENIKKFLKKALIDSGWSVQHLATLINVEQSNVSRAINHPLNCKITTLLRISDKLGVSLLNPEI